MGFQPGAEDVLAVAEIERVVGQDGAAGVTGHLFAGSPGPVLILLVLSGLGQGSAELLLLIAELAEFAEETGGGALGRGGWVVEFVGKVGRELAERGELLRLQLDAG